MFRPRIIPVLLLEDKRLVKSTRFSAHRYIGDPINATRIFSEARADELVFLDIGATRERRCISSGFVDVVGSEANMPFAVGGGITTLAQIKELLSRGAEKVVLGTIAAESPSFVTEAAETFGSSTIVVCIDVRTTWLRGEKVRVRNGRVAVSTSVVEYARRMQALGAGELILQSMDRDGTQQGYDVELVRRVVTSVDIPVVALGGAGTLAHLGSAYFEARPNALAAGSLFLYKGSRNGVLINYPDATEKRALVTR